MMAFSQHCKRSISLLTALALLLGNLGASLPQHCACQIFHQVAEDCACCSGSAHNRTTAEPMPCCSNGQQALHGTEQDDLPDGVRSLSSQGELCSCLYNSQPLEVTVAESFDTARVQFFLAALVHGCVTDPPVALQAGSFESEPTGSDSTLPLRILLCVWRT